MNEFISNAPENYICPICLGIDGIENEHTLMKQTDIIYKDDLVTAFINSFFVGKNSGHAIIVPNKHFEAIYDIPLNYGQRVFDVSQKIALAIKKTYKCEGVTIKQNNEPAGDQHAFHYHLHVFPRYKNDGFNNVMPKDKRLADPKERETYAEKLKKALLV